MQMSTNTSTRRQHRVLLALFMLIPVIAGIAGCAATELTSHDVAQNRQVRLLALDCYNNHEGFRLAYGGAEVWEACRETAESRVRGTYANNVQASANFPGHRHD